MSDQHHASSKERQSVRAGVRPALTLLAGCCFSSQPLLSFAEATYGIYDARTLAMGMMEGIVAWFRETWRKDDASEAVLQLESLRAKRTLDLFEGEASSGKLNGPVSIGHIILACTLGWCDVRHTSCDWRTGRPKLVTWFESFEQRPSMQKTMPPPL